MATHGMTDRQRIDQLSTAWRAIADRMGETLNTSTILDLSEHAKLLIVGQQCAKLGLQLQLWLFDATHSAPH